MTNQPAPLSDPTANRTLHKYNPENFTALDAVGSFLSGLSDNTRRTYETAIEQFVEFASVPFDAVTPRTVAEFKQYLKTDRADTTVHNRLSALSSLYDYFKQLEIVGTNPFSDVNRSDLDTDPYQSAKRLSLEDFRSILDVIDTDSIAGARNHALFLFYFFCGFRRSEILDVTRGDFVQTDDGTVYVTVRMKGDNTRRREVPDRVLQAIDHYLSLDGRSFDDMPDEACVFRPTRPGGPTDETYEQNIDDTLARPGETDRSISGDSVYKALKRYATKAGVDPGRVSVHALRHLGGIVYADHAEDLQEVQAFLNHKRLDTTQIYLEDVGGSDHKHADKMAEDLDR